MARNGRWDCRRRTFGSSKLPPIWYLAFYRVSTPVQITIEIHVQNHSKSFESKPQVCWLTIVILRNRRGLFHGVHVSKPGMPIRTNPLIYPAGWHHCRPLCDPARGSRPWRWKQHPLAASKLGSRKTQIWWLAVYFNIASMSLNLFSGNMTLWYSNWVIHTTHAGVGQMMCTATATLKSDGPTWPYFGLLTSPVPHPCWKLPW